MTRPDYDLINTANRVGDATRIETSALYKAAVDALTAKQFAEADSYLSVLMQRAQAPADTHFLLAVAKIGLGQWNEAKSLLETAVAREPLRPEPRTRLGLTYLQLNDTARAQEQRSELVKLDAACGGACADATWISEGIVLIDQAMASNWMQALAAASAPVRTSIPPSRSAVPRDIDPARYSLVAFSDERDLYALLTAEGRCKPRTLAPPREPCALILYTPMGDTGIAANFKPVFAVISRRQIWAVHDKKLQKIPVEDLYFDNEEIIGHARATYRSIALVGNSENAANCESGRPCLKGLVAEDMFGMYGDMPPSVVEAIWGGGMRDVGLKRVQ